jgi:hypothetical protein
MDKLDKELVQVLEEPIKILKRDKILVSNLKKENEKLKREVEILLRNNKTLVELIEVLEEKIKKFITTSKEKYIYDFERGWVEKDSLEKGKMEIDKKDMSLEKVNLQLEEILKLMRLHKERNLREE